MDERKLIYADDAIEAIDEITWYHQNINNEMVRGANSSEDQAWYKAEDVYEALEQLPSVQPEQSSEIQDILEYLDTVLHPIISPDHWNVYSELHDMISMLPSAQQIDVQEAYYRGKIDGIKECTTRLKKMNEEFANGRHDLQTSGDRCAEPTS